MNTFCRLNNGDLFVVFSDNTNDETMDLIPISDCDEYGNYDIETIICDNYAYSDIKCTDTNMSAL